MSVILLPANPIPSPFPSLSLFTKDPDIFYEIEGNSLTTSVYEGLVRYKPDSPEIEPALAESFLQGVFAEGVDAGSDAGLSLIASRAGLSAADVAAALADSGWRAVAEANRADLLARGLWGVPSFRINERPAVWGQDRLWMLEQDLIQTVTAPPMAGETV